MARPPMSMALNEASVPDSLPIGVRAPETMTEPAFANLHDGLCGDSRWATTLSTYAANCPCVSITAERSPASGAGWWRCREHGHLEGHRARQARAPRPRPERRAPPHPRRVGRAQHRPRRHRRHRQHRRSPRRTHLSRKLSRRRGDRCRAAVTDFKPGDVVSPTATASPTSSASRCASGRMTSPSPPAGTPRRRSSATGRSSPRRWTAASTFGRSRPSPCGRPPPITCGGGLSASTA